MGVYANQAVMNFFSNRNAGKKGAGIKTVLFILLLVFLFFVVSNLCIMRTEKEKIYPAGENLPDGADCILILGAGVWDGGVPSPMLSDRLDEGIRLYNAGAAPKILVSGDHGRTGYDEVNVMKKYLTDAGIPSSDVFMDHAGFSTYDSMKRAKTVFGVRKAVIVTQEYHLYRALYICGHTGIETYGVPSDPRRYAGEAYRNFREWIARDKDIFACLFDVPPKYLGDAIDIHGDGDVTND